MVSDKDPAFFGHLATRPLRVRPEIPPLMAKWPSGQVAEIPFWGRTLSHSVKILALVISLAASFPTAARAADTTAPTTPVVTDEGTYTTSTIQLHATWTSSDPESGIAEYQYLIRQDSTSGTIIVNWTSTGTTASVTHTTLGLIQGKSYYFQIKAKNGDGLWSAVGSSNGIKVDTTAPGTPGLPKEGSSTTDYDFDGDGSYTVYWAAAADAESGISAYEVQERIGVSGMWTTLTNNRTNTNFSVTGRLDKTQYFYQVRAKNGAGLWGDWSSSSDGVLIDKTAPSTVTTVTDDGAVAASTTELHATWTTSSDPESGVVQYEYIIRQDSILGTIIVNYTSVGLATESTRTGLSLINGKLYYVGVRVKNGAGLYSATRYSDGIRVPDPTAPSAPQTPTEGSNTTDYDYDGDGSYTVYWSAATDPDSGISAYELQERLGTSGTWSTLTSTTTATSFAVSSRLDKNSYFYQVRAKNGVGTWGAWSSVSDGILIDKTAPSMPATVTDDGATTFSTTQLHATWSPSSDAESGILLYEYIIRQDSTLGTIIVNYTSVGLATEVTKTGLVLINGKKYFIGVRAKNGSSLYSSVKYSDGITVQADTTPPTGTIQINNGVSATNQLTVTLSLSATDDSGTVSQMRFSEDNLTYTTPEPFTSSKPWTLPTGDGTKSLTIKFSDPSGNWSAPVSDTIVLDTTPPILTFSAPTDGALLGRQ